MCWHPCPDGHSKVIRDARRGRDQPHAWQTNEQRCSRVGPHLKVRSPSSVCARLRVRFGRISFSSERRPCSSWYPPQRCLVHARTTTQNCPHSHARSLRLHLPIQVRHSMCSMHVHTILCMDAAPCRVPQVQIQCELRPPVLACTSPACREGCVHSAVHA